SPLKYGPRDKTAKQYQVRLQAGSSYVIDMRSTKVDSYLVLKGPNDEEVARDDDSGGELNARIRYLRPAQGDYSIWATTFDGSEGEFELTMLEIRPIEAAGEIRVAGGAERVVDGQLTKDAYETGFGPGVAYALHIPKVAAGTTCQLDLTSAVFEPMLRLEKPTRLPIATAAATGVT